MKKTLLLIIMPLVVFGAMYMAGSFANASFDLSKWGEFSRGMVAVWGIFFGAVCSFIIYQEIK